MAKQISIMELGKALDKELEKIEGAMATILTTLADKAYNDAKSMIGQHDPRWAPLAPSTVQKHLSNRKHIESYVRHDGAKMTAESSTLFVTGALYESIQKDVSHVRDSKAPYSAVGSTSPVMKHMEYGTITPTGEVVPPRPVFQYVLSDMMSEMPEVTREAFHGRVTTKVSS